MLLIVLFSVACTFILGLATLTAYLLFDKHRASAAPLTSLGYLTPLGPVAIVVPSGADVRLREAEDCRNRRDYHCAETNVKLVLESTQGAPAEIEARTIALAIQAATDFDQQNFSSAEREYNDAISLHATNGDDHASQWKQGLAAAYANDAEEKLADDQTKKGQDLGQKAWDTINLIAGNSTLPSSIDYDHFPSKWISLPAIGDKSTAEGAELRGQYGLRFNCDQGQLTYVRIIDAANASLRPILHWSWAVDVIPEEGDARTLNHVDEAVQVLVGFEDKKEGDIKVLHYVWDSRAPVGFPIVRATGEPAARPDGRFPKIKILMVVKRSGSADVAKGPISEQANIVEDYLKFFPGLHASDIPPMRGVAVQTRCYDTKSKANGWISPLYFLPADSQRANLTREPSMRYTHTMGER